MLCRYYIFYLISVLCLLRYENALPDLPSMIRIRNEGELYDLYQKELEPTLRALRSVSAEYDNYRKQCNDFLKNMTAAGALSEEMEMYHRRVLDSIHELMRVNNGFHSQLREFYQRNYDIFMKKDEGAMSDANLIEACNDARFATNSSDFKPYNHNLRDFDLTNFWDFRHKLGRKNFLARMNNMHDKYAACFIYKRDTLDDTEADLDGKNINEKHEKKRYNSPGVGGAHAYSVNSQWIKTSNYPDTQVLTNALSNDHQHTALRYHIQQGFPENLQKIINEVGEEFLNKRNSLMDKDDGVPIDLDGYANDYVNVGERGNEFSKTVEPRKQSLSIGNHRVSTAKLQLPTAPFDSLNITTNAIKLDKESLNKRNATQQKFLPQLGHLDSGNNVSQSAIERYHIQQGFPENLQKIINKVGVEFLSKRNCPVGAHNEIDFELDGSTNVGLSAYGPDKEMSKRDYPIGSDSNLPSISFVYPSVRNGSGDFGKELLSKSNFIMDMDQQPLSLPDPIHPNPSLNVNQSDEERYHNQQGFPENLQKIINDDGAEFLSKRFCQVGRNSTNLLSVELPSETIGDPENELGAKRGSSKDKYNRYALASHGCATVHADRGNKDLIKNNAFSVVIDNQPPTSSSDDPNQNPEGYQKNMNELHSNVQNCLQPDFATPSSNGNLFPAAHYDLLHKFPRNVRAIIKDLDSKNKQQLRMMKSAVQSNLPPNVQSIIDTVGEELIAKRSHSLKKVSPSPKPPSTSLIHPHNYTHNHSSIAPFTTPMHEALKQAYANDAKLGKYIDEFKSYMVNKRLGTEWKTQQYANVMNGVAKTVRDLRISEKGDRTLAGYANEMDNVMNNVVSLNKLSQRICRADDQANSVAEQQKPDVASQAQMEKYRKMVHGAFNDWLDKKFGVGEGVSIDDRNKNMLMRTVLNEKYNNVVDKILVELLEKPQHGEIGGVARVNDEAIRESASTNTGEGKNNSSNKTERSKTDNTAQQVETAKTAENSKTAEVEIPITVTYQTNKQTPTYTDTHKRNVVESMMHERNEETNFKYNDQTVKCDGLVKSLKGDDDNPICCLMENVSDDNPVKRLKRLIEEQEKALRSKSSKSGTDNPIGCLESKEERVSDDFKVKCPKRHIEEEVLRSTKTRPSKDSDDNAICCLDDSEKSASDDFPVKHLKRHIKEEVLRSTKPRSSKGGVDNPICCLKENFSDDNPVKRLKRLIEEEAKALQSTQPRSSKSGTDNPIGCLDSKEERVSDDFKVKCPKRHIEEEVLRSTKTRPSKDSDDNAICCLDDSEQSASADFPVKHPKRHIEEEVLRSTKPRSSKDGVDNPICCFEDKDERVADANEFSMKHRKRHIKEEVLHSSKPGSSKSDTENPLLFLKNADKSALDDFRVKHETEWQTKENILHSTRQGSPKNGCDSPVCCLKDTPAQETVPANPLKRQTKAYDDDQPLKHRKHSDNSNLKSTLKKISSKSQKGKVGKQQLYPKKVTHRDGDDSSICCLSGNRSRNEDNEIETPMFARERHSRLKEKRALNKNDLDEEQPKPDRPFMHAQKRQNVQAGPRSFKKRAPKNDPGSSIWSASNDLEEKQPKKRSHELQIESKRPYKNFAEYDEAYANLKHQHAHQELNTYHMRSDEDAKESQTREASHETDSKIQNDQNDELVEADMRLSEKSLPKDEELQSRLRISKSIEEPQQEHESLSNMQMISSETKYEVKKEDVAENQELDASIEYTNEPHEIEQQEVRKPRKGSKKHKPLKAPCQHFDFYGKAFGKNSELNSEEIEEQPQVDYKTDDEKSKKDRKRCNDNDNKDYNEKGEQSCADDDTKSRGTTYEPQKRSIETNKYPNTANSELHEVEQQLHNPQGRRKGHKPRNAPSQHFELYDKAFGKNSKRSSVEIGQYSQVDDKTDDQQPGIEIKRSNDKDDQDYDEKAEQGCADDTKSSSTNKHKGQDHGGDRFKSRGNEDYKRSAIGYKYAKVSSDDRFSGEESFQNNPSKFQTSDEYLQHQRDSKSSFSPRIDKRRQIHTQMSSFSKPDLSTDGADGNPICCFTTDKAYHSHDHKHLMRSIDHEELNKEQPKDRPLSTIEQSSSNLEDQQCQYSAGGLYKDNHLRGAVTRPISSRVCAFTASPAMQQSLARYAKTLPNLVTQQKRDLASGDVYGDIFSGSFPAMISKPLNTGTGLDLALPVTNVLPNHDLLESIARGMNVTSMKLAEQVATMSEDDIAKDPVLYEALKKYLVDSLNMFAANLSAVPDSDKSRSPKQTDNFLLDSQSPKQTDNTLLDSQFQNEVAALQAGGGDDNSSAVASHGSKNESEIAIAMDKVFTKLEKMQCETENSPKQHVLPDGLSCEITGSWNSLSLGLQFDFSSPKAMERNLAPAESCNKLMSVEIRECNPQRKHGFMDKDWKVMGSALRLTGGPFFLYAQKQTEPLCATFLGYCIICGGADTLYGTWTFHNVTRNCQDIVTSTDFKADMMRRHEIASKKKPNRKLNFSYLRT